MAFPDEHGEPVCGVGDAVGGAEGSTAKNRQNYTWTQDGVGRPYVQSVLQTLDPGQSYQKQATTTQTLDVYGNVTQAVANNYAGLSPASRTQTVTYVTNTAYTSRYMRNRPLQVQITDGTETITVTNNYDQGGPAATVGTPRQHDGANYGTSWTLRGNLTNALAPGKTSNLSYDITGAGRRERWAGPRGGV